MVRATTHQGDETFSVVTRGTQCTTNSFVFLVKDAVSRISTVSEMDGILQHGDHLHAAFNASLGRTAGKLAFDELEKCIEVLNGEDETQLQFGPSQHGDILANNSQPPFVTLDAALKSAKGANGALLRVGEYTTAVQVLSDDSVRLFDPHARDESGYVSGNGTAIVIDFQDIAAFHCYLKRFVQTKGTGVTTGTADDPTSAPLTWRSFEMMPLLVASNDCLKNILNSITTSNTGNW